MDVLGILAVYDPTSLPKLQYISGLATAGIAIGIPKSKFIIIFPSNSYGYMMSTYGTAMICPAPMLLGPNSYISMMNSKTDVSVNFNIDGNSITFSNNSYYTIAYCPV